MLPWHMYFVMERRGKLRNMDRSFGIEYWRRLGPRAIFAATRELLVEAEKRIGRPADELRLDRSAESVHKVGR